MKQSLDYIKEYYPENWVKIEMIPIDDVLEIIEKVQSELTPKPKFKRMKGLIKESEKVAIFAAIKEIYGIERYEIEELRTLKYRKQHQMICGYFMGKDIPQDEIGTVVNRAKSTVSYMVKEFVIKDSKDLMFKMEFKEFKERVKLCQQK